MFVRAKVIGGQVKYYLVHSVRVGKRVRQKVLAYLGQFDCVEDAYVNASGKRRRKLARFRDPADILADLYDRSAWLEYKGSHRGDLQPSTDTIRVLLPHLPL